MLALLHASIAGRMEFLQWEQTATPRIDNETSTPDATLQPVHVCILTFNALPLLPHTIEHYRRMLPHSYFTVLDNNSTDATVTVAMRLGAEVIIFDTTHNSWMSRRNLTRMSGRDGSALAAHAHGHQDEHKQRDMKENCWRRAPSRGWHILVDFDEWIDLTEADLLAEQAQGTSVLTVQGFAMVGASKFANLSDLDPHSLMRGCKLSMRRLKPCVNPADSPCSVIAL